MAILDYARNIGSNIMGGSRIQKDTGGITRIPFKLGGNPIFSILNWLLNKGDDDDPNWFQNQAQDLRKIFKDRFHYKPAEAWTPRLDPRGAPITDQGYTAAELNRMNALGGWYSEPARAARRRQARIENMMTRREEGKPISELNLATLTGKQESDIQRGSYTAPTRQAPKDWDVSSGMGPGGKHYAGGGLIDRPFTGRNRYI